MSLISSLAMVIMGFYESVEDLFAEDGELARYQFLKPILKVIDEAMIPILICVIAAGSIYAVILWINLAKAECSDKREEAKKRLINAIVGFGIIIVLIVVTYALAANIKNIVGIADDAVSSTEGSFFRMLLK